MCCCDRSEKIRLLSLCLRETQAQYADCVSEAAEQDALLELQREAIQHLRKRILRRDEVFRWLATEAREFFGARIAGVGLVGSKIDGRPSRCHGYPEEKIRRTENPRGRMLVVVEGEADCERTTTDPSELENNKAEQSPIAVNFLSRENQHLRRQLRARRLEFRIFDEQVEKRFNEANLGVADKGESGRGDEKINWQSLPAEEQGRRGQVESVESIGGDATRDERRGKLKFSSEAREQSWERETFQKCENPEGTSGREKRESGAVRETVDTPRSRSPVDGGSREDGDARFGDGGIARTTRESTRGCLAEWRVSEETLSRPWQRISSLKRPSRETLEETAKSRVDRPKTNPSLDDRSIIDDNYGRVSDEDSDGSRRRLWAEVVFPSVEGWSASDGGGESSDDSTEKPSAREEYLREKWREARERVALLRHSERSLTRRLDECRLENRRLEADNDRLRAKSREYSRELEEARRTLLELKRECERKTETLDWISAEFESVASSRSELCRESRLVVARVRSWIDQQRKLVENLSKRLKNEKNRIARCVFEKRALVARVKELRRLDAAAPSYSTTRGKTRRGGRGERPGKEKAAHARPFPKVSTPFRPWRGRFCLTRTSRRTLLRGNSWWFPKLEHVSKELSREKKAKEDGGRSSETSTDEARDFGYQSSASK